MDWVILKNKIIINESGWKVPYKNICTQYECSHLTDNVSCPAVARTTDKRPSLLGSKVNRLILCGHDHHQTMTAPTRNHGISREWGTTADSEILACFLNQLRQKKEKETKIKIKYALSKCNDSLRPFSKNHLKAP